MQDSSLVRRPASMGAVRPPQTVLGYNPFSRQRTSYSGMTEWLQMLGKRQTDNVPVTRVGLSWEPRRVVTANATTNPYLTHWLLDGNASNNFSRQYLDIMQSKAMREQQVGPYRTREGNLGSTWRNVKEVMSYGGNRIYYLDGITRINDMSGLNDAIARGGAPMRYKQRTPMYAMNRHDISSHRRRDQLLQEKRAYRPWHSTELKTTLPAIREEAPRPIRRTFTAEGGGPGGFPRPPLQPLAPVREV